MKDENYLKQIIEYVNLNLKIDIGSDTRKREYVEGRSLYFTLARKHTMFSYEEIGQHIGRNHATVIWGCNRVFEFAIKENKLIKKTYDAFIFKDSNEIDRLIYLTKELHELETKILNDYCLVLN
jgi:chromosomal replication initiation ATPase DnaA